MITKEVEFQDENGKTQKATLKRLSFREWNKLEEESTDAKIVGGQPIVKASSSRLKDLALLKGVVDCTIPLANINDLDKLDRTSGETLFIAFMELNSQNLKKND